jgi:S-(hydroxymethyl)glutathione dehydrogenase/alcohol dehydrogenase
MKTKAAILRALNAPLEIVDIEIPSLQKGQVLVQIAYSGICQSQLNEIRGYKGHDPYLPHTLGHEASGIVLEVGEGVTKVQKGDHVVASWIKGEGLESSSSVYSHEGQKICSGAISTFLEKAVIAENRLIPISKQMPLKEASLLGCALPTGAGVVFHEMKLSKGSSLAIFGAGGIGMSALLAAKHVQASPIIMIDIVEQKLQKALENGATHTINSSKGDVLERIKNIMGMDGVDFALECVGKKEVMETAFKSVKSKGGLCILAGNVPQGEKMQIDPFDLIRGKRILGTWGGKSSIENDVQKYVALFLAGQMDWKSFITHEIRLENINSFFESFRRGEVGRGIISFV